MLFHHRRTCQQWRLKRTPPALHNGDSRPERPQDLTFELEQGLQQPQWPVSIPCPSSSTSKGIPAQADLLSHAGPPAGMAGRATQTVCSRPPRCRKSSETSCLPPCSRYMQPPSTHIPCTLLQLCFKEKRPSFQRHTGCTFSMLRAPAVSSDLHACAGCLARQDGHHGAAAGPPRVPGGGAARGAVRGRDGRLRLRRAAPCAPRSSPANSCAPAWSACPRWDLNQPAPASLAELLALRAVLHRVHVMQESPLNLWLCQDTLTQVCRRHECERMHSLT